MKKLEIKTSQSTYDLIDYDATDFDCVEYLGSLSIDQYKSRIMIKHARFCYTVKGDLVEAFNQIKKLGIHFFENPVPEPCEMNYLRWEINYAKAEQKTFYKPILIKIK